MIGQTETKALGGAPVNGEVVEAFDEFMRAFEAYKEANEERLRDAAGVASSVAPEDYFVDAASVPARIVRGRAASWPAPGQVANGIEIDIIVGYGPTPSSVPQPLRLAVLMLVAHWFENREPVLVGAPPEPVPLGVGALVAPYRAARL